MKTKRSFASSQTCVSRTGDCAQEYSEYVRAYQTSRGVRSEKLRKLSVGLDAVWSAHEASLSPSLKDKAATNLRFGNFFRR